MEERLQKLSYCVENEKIIIFDEDIWKSSTEVMRDEYFKENNAKILRNPKAIKLQIMGPNDILPKVFAHLIGTNENEITLDMLKSHSKEAPKRTPLIGIPKFSNQQKLKDVPPKTEIQQTSQNQPELKFPEQKVGSLTPPVKSMDTKRDADNVLSKETQIKPSLSIPERTKRNEIETKHIDPKSIADSSSFKSNQVQRNVQQPQPTESQKPKRIRREPPPMPEMSNHMNNSKSYDSSEADLIYENGVLIVKDRDFRQRLNGVLYISPFAEYQKLIINRI